MPASGEAEGQLKAPDMTLPLRPWLLLLPPLLLLLLSTPGPPGRVCSEELRTEGNLVEQDVDHSGAGEAVLSENVTESTRTTDAEDSSSDVVQARGGDLDTTFGSTETPTESPEEGADGLVMMVAVPLILLALIALVVAVFFVCRKQKAKCSHFRDEGPDEFLAGSNEEKVPMPMFEDDVPSVLELEMEDLEKWMVKDSGGTVQDPGKEK